MMTTMEKRCDKIYAKFRQLLFDTLPKLDHPRHVYGSADVIFHIYNTGNFQHDFMEGEIKLICDTCGFDYEIHQHSEYNPDCVAVQFWFKDRIDISKYITPSSKNLFDMKSVNKKIKQLRNEYKIKLNYI